MNINQGETKQQRSNPFERKSGQKDIDPKKVTKFVVILVIAVALLVLINSSFYIVREDQLATIREFGEIKKIVIGADNEDAIKQNALDSRFKDVAIDKSKGLKFKIPFITSVEVDSSKLNTYISNTAKINTKDKIKYEIKMFAQWKITHPGIFRTSLGTIARASSKIDEVAYAVVIDRINRLTSFDFLNNKDAVSEILGQAMVELNDKLDSQGIKLVDIDVYRTIIPQSNVESTYKKMIAERAAIAQQIRSEGLEIYNNTVSDTDRKVTEIKADAIEKSEKIRGEADAEALEIYASGFSKDPDFYEFWRTLKSYEETIDENTVIFLDKNNQYIEIFSDPQMKVE